MASTGMTPDLAPPYVLDARGSRFVVRATAGGPFSAFGHNPTIAIRQFTGDVRFRPEAPEQSSLRLRIDPNSLAVTGEVNDKDRHEMERMMREEVLETSSFNEITFQSSTVEPNQIAAGMYRMKIAGKLNLHGVERDLEISCNVTAGEDSLRAYGDFTVRQTDYGIELVSVAGGAVKLKDELKFSFDIVAHRSRESGG